MSRLCIVTAMAAESRPFLDRWRFRAQSSHPLRSYSSDDYLLLQTGLGKLRAAAGVSALLHCTADISAIVNIGIAGADLPLGTVVLAHSVCDAATGTRWYPHLPDNRKFPAPLRSLPSAQVLTLDTPGTDYRRDTLFDMEAAGIFLAATRYLSTSQVHSIKLVSDNPEHPLTRTQANIKQTATNMLEQQFDTLSSLLSVIRTSCAVDPSIHHAIDQQQHRLLQQAHHTRTEQQLLKRLLQRLQALGIDPQLQLCEDAGSAKAIRRHLQSLADSASLTYPQD